MSMAEADDNQSHPSTLAHGLSNAHYIDPDVHARENEAVLFTSWSSIRFAKDIPNPGDASPVEFLGRPLLLVRGKDDDLHVFENVCRHRGMVLVDKPTTFKGVIRCPYHSWCYGFNAALKTTPHVGGPGIHDHPDMDKENLGLVPVRSQVWMGIIFVNISGDGQAFSDYIAPVEARWSDFMGKPIFHAGEDSSFHLEVNCNWKLAIENYCESYHLPWVHPALNQYSKLEDHYKIIEEAGQFSGQGTRVYAPSLDETGHRFIKFEGLPDKWDTAGEYI
jgi:choline monooxygenase